MDLCYASSEEIPELQRPRPTTGNRRNLQCGDDSILRANVTRDTWSPCLGVVGASVWGVGLAGCRFLSASKYIARSLSMSGAALSTRLMGALRFRGSCSYLASARGHEWLAFVRDVLSQGSSTTCGISGGSVEALHVITIWW